MAYKITGRKSGTVTFQPGTGTITQETMTKSSKMTSNAIEGDVYKRQDHFLSLSAA